jgi:hypothetical protein
MPAGCRERPAPGSCDGCGLAVEKCYDTNEAEAIPPCILSVLNERLLPLHVKHMGAKYSREGSHDKK